MEGRAVGLRERGSTAVAAHPLRAVAVASLAVGAGHAWWVWTHRHVGAYDPDEAGYLADAFRFHRALVSHGPGALVTEIRYSGTAPLVPLVSAVLLIIGPTDPRMAMMVQPLLLTVFAVATAAIALCLAPGRIAAAAGAALLALPITILATQSYWFGLAVAATLAVAVWALVTSDAGTNRHIWFVGLALAAMLSSRTMAVGFVPGLVAAVVVTVRGSRRGTSRAAASLAVGVMAAAPWYVVQRDVIFGYLFSYGYGTRSERFGSASLVGRLADRGVEQLKDAGVLLPILVTVAAVVLVVAGSRRDGWRPVATRWLGRSEVAALVLVAVGGFAALLSTSNRGGFFALPLLSVTVPLAALVLHRSLPAVRRVAGGIVVLQGVLLLTAAWWLVPYGAPVPLPSHHESVLEGYDARLGPDHRDDATAAAADWADVDRWVATRLRPLRDRGAAFTMTGNMVLLNTNSVALAGELDSWTTDFRVPDTGASAATRAESLTARDWSRDGRRVERVLVVVRGDRIRFTPDLDSERFRTQALDAGWRVVDSRALPGGGSVEILRRGAVT